MTGIPAGAIAIAAALLAGISWLAIAALGKRDAYRADAAQFLTDGDGRER